MPPPPRNTPPPIPPLPRNTPPPPIPPLRRQPPPAAPATGNTAVAATPPADGSAAAAPLRHANANGQAATQSNPQNESHLECASIGELTSAAPRTQPGECALVEIAPSEREKKTNGRR